jgi:hypothetical protein
VLADMQRLLVNVFGSAALLAIAVGCWWVASRIEPHRIARDQSWFTCRSRVIDVGRAASPPRPSLSAGALMTGTQDRGPKNGSWNEARVFLRDDGTVEIVPRSRRAQGWTAPIATASDQAKGRLRYYSLETNPLVEFRIPAKSKIRAELDRRVTR